MQELLKAISESVSVRRWLIALDRDGTLVPYAPRPEEARVEPDVYDMLNELSGLPGFCVAIVSARSVAQLRGDFSREHLILAGNYGMEVLFPDGRLVVQPQALRAVPQLKGLRDQLAANIDLNSGAILEDHGYSLCLHWNQVHGDELDAFHNSVNAAAQAFPEVRVRRLETSYEALPNIPWDKGEAMKFIATHLSAPQAPVAAGASPLATNPVAVGESRLDPEPDWFYFYGGDTDADRPAFMWVNDCDGISVRVGPADNLGATFRLDTPADLHAALQFLKDTRAAAAV